MPKACLRGVILAESDEHEVVEGNIYFPPDSISREYFTDSDLHTHCLWKGDASYFHITVNDELSKDAAWHYPQTLDAAKHIEGYVAFWGEVEISQ
jgi:uncharacterized protein (DUF427 family)